MGLKSNNFDLVSEIDGSEVAIKPPSVQYLPRVHGISKESEDRFESGFF